jgi:hypothetical protein
VPIINPAAVARLNASATQIGDVLTLSSNDINLLSPTNGAASPLSKDEQKRQENQPLLPSQSGDMISSGDSKGQAGANVTTTASSPTSPTSDTFDRWTRISPVFGHPHTIDQEVSYHIMKLLQQFGSAYIHPSVSCINGNIDRRC